MVVFLDNLFDDFCKYLDGKLRWSETKDREWTETIFRFFSEKNLAEVIPYEEARDYMTVDYTWRFNPAKYSIYDIELALEHESQENDVAVLVNKEVQHLVDLKARNKIGIFYPRIGDERDLIEEIQRKIKNQSDDMKLSHEKYLIILGYATTKISQRAMLFKGFILNGKGDIEKRMEQVVFQAYKVT
jgi:hypothetical protein